MKTARVRIEGRVQGVGYRNWTCQKAQELDLQGWVRNRKDGSVEAVFHGPDSQIETMLKLCGQGPLAAKVTALHVENQEAYEGPACFSWLESV